MTTALLIMDVQNSLVERFPDGAPEMLHAIGRAADAARAADLPVIYVRVGFRPGAPEVSARNAGFAAVASWGGFDLDDPGTQVHAAVAPEPGDHEVVKKRVSAFTGSDLGVLLRSLDVHALVLTGIATSGVVLSTLKEAADLDFELAVLSDGCIDPDPEVHRVLLGKLFPRQATVLTADEWVGDLVDTKG